MDKRKLLLLKFLLDKCSDGGYKVLDTAKLYSAHKKYNDNFKALENDLNFLKTYKYIDIKYIDKTNTCLCILDNSRIFQENLKLERATRRGYATSLIVNMIVSGLMAFVGAFLAVILTR